MEDGNIDNGSAQVDLSRLPASPTTRVYMERNHRPKSVPRPLSGRVPISLFLLPKLLLVNCSSVAACLDKMGFVSQVEGAGGKVYRASLYPVCLLYVF